MGTSRSGAELAMKLQKVAQAQGKANRKAVSAAALVYKESVLATGAEDIGGDMRLSHWGWNGKTYRQPKLGAGYDVKGYERAVALLRARPQGLWKFLEIGAQPHPIALRKRNKKRGLKMQGGMYARSVQHPGVRGRRTWSRGVAAGQAPAMRAYKLSMQRSLLNEFR